MAFFILIYKVFSYTIVREISNYVMNKSNTH